jgi:hypothetical protein
MKIFVSHVREDKIAAVALKKQLETALPGAAVWVSSIDLGLGAAWLQAIEKELKGAKAMVVLCGSQSAGKPWINFESGFGHGKKMPVIPVCHRGLRKNQLPYPLSIFQPCDAADSDECAALVSRLAGILEIAIAADFSPDTMSNSLVPRFERGHEIGVVLAHRQSEWEITGHSPFGLPNGLPDVWRDRWRFRPITSEDKIVAAELGVLSGMVVGSPWQSAMSRECIDELVDWVHAGGRMLLLGFELGDRHHNGNLSELARRFGIHPMIDIVGPRDRGKGKPYGVWIDFRAGDARTHPVNRHLDRIRLRNVQTVMVEPGGHEWLCVGEHAIFRPARERVYYRDGLLTQPGGGQFEVNPNAAWIPVGVEAPSGLAYSGAVRFLGTWDILRAPSGIPAHDTPKLVERLFDWLADQGA